MCVYDLRASQKICFHNISRKLFGPETSWMYIEGAFGHGSGERSFELYLPVEWVRCSGRDVLAIYHLADGPTNGPDKSEKSGDTAKIKNTKNK